jgi:hypothetical protein
MNDQLGRDLAGRVGKVERMDVDEKGRAWGEFLHFRASIKVKEPVMRCVSVFSQKRQQLEQFTVMYENLPTFCFSCGLLGHSSTACPTPAERDADGFLPYHGPRLCVPDDRKKKTSGTGSSQGSFMSDQGSRQSQGRGGPKMQTHDKSATPQKGKEAGNITSPAKSKQSGQRKTRGAGTEAPGNTANVVRGGNVRISGQKRKEYRPKVPAQANAIDLPSTDVPARALVLAATITPATDNGGEDNVADSESSANKKHKTGVQETSTRSADQAEAARQPRQTQ